MLDPVTLLFFSIVMSVIVWIIRRKSQVAVPDFYEYGKRYRSINRIIKISMIITLSLFIIDLLFFCLFISRGNLTELSKYELVFRIILFLSLPVALLVFFVKLIYDILIVLNKSIITGPEIKINTIKNAIYAIGIIIFIIGLIKHL
jgi:hypothetical protein